MMRFSQSCPTLSFSSEPWKQHWLRITLPLLFITQQFTLWEELFWDQGKSGYNPVWTWCTVPEPGITMHPLVVPLISTSRSNYGNIWLSTCTFDILYRNMIFWGGNDGILEKKKKKYIYMRKKIILIIWFLCGDKMKIAPEIFMFKIDASSNLLFFLCVCFFLITLPYRVGRLHADYYLLKALFSFVPHTNGTHGTYFPTVSVQSSH